MGKCAISAAAGLRTRFSEKRSDGSVTLGGATPRAISDLYRIAAALE